MNSELLARQKKIVMRDFLIEVLIQGKVSDGFINGVLSNRACEEYLMAYYPRRLTQEGYAYIKQHEHLK